MICDNFGCVLEVRNSGACWLVALSCVGAKIPFEIVRVDLRSIGLSIDQSIDYISLLSTLLLFRIALVVPNSSEKTTQDQPVVSRFGVRDLSLANSS